MKLIITILALFLIINCFGQKKTAFNKHAKDTTNQVCFVAKFHMSDLDKDDAAILNGYVVAIGYEQAKKINGKKIRITGKVAIINNSNNRLRGLPIPQQREGPYKYIASPKIEIIN